MRIMTNNSIIVYFFMRLTEIKLNDANFSI